MVQAGANSLDPDPHPTGHKMYCSPLILNVTGIDSMAEPV